MTSKAQAIKEKTANVDIIKSKSFCAVKRQPKEQEEIFANHVSNMRLVSRIYKKHLELSNKRTNNWIKKMRKGSEKTFHQRIYIHTNEQ